MKDKNYVNLILGSSEWKLYHRKEFTKELINNGEEITFVNQPVSLIINIFIKFRSKFLALLLGELKVNKDYGFLVLTPVMIFHFILWRKSSLLAVIDSYFFSYQINRFIKKYYSDKVVRLWVFMPEHKYLVGKINYDILIYDSYDDCDLNFDGTINKKRSKLNKELLCESDFIIVISKYTFEKYSKYTKNIIRSRGGYTPSIFENNNQRIPITDIQKAILGYIGTFRNWIDYSLIDKLIETDSFVLVFVGYIDRGSIKYFNKILKNRSVIHINHLDIKDVPSYVNSFSVGLIPFKINDFMRSVYPNKFFEYISSRIPVVTTALPELERFKDYIGYSENNDTFIENCKKAAEGKFLEKISKYDQIRAKNDWNYVVKEILQEIRKIN